LRWNGVKFRPRKIRIPHPPSVRGAPQTGCTTAPTIGAPKGRSAPHVRCIQSASTAPVEGASLEEPSPHSELQGTAQGGRASAPPQSAVASEPAGPKQRRDRGRIEMEI